MWYSYAIVRVVPRVERGEFVNVGVILLAREQRFLGALIEFEPDRVRALAPSLDVAMVERHLATFQSICQGVAAGGPIAALEPPERFHWLVAPRSTIIQTSPVHIGRTLEPQDTLDHLLQEFVRLPPAAAPTLA